MAAVRVAARGAVEAGCASARRARTRPEKGSADERSRRPGRRPGREGRAGHGRRRRDRAGARRGVHASRGQHRPRVSAGGPHDPRQAVAEAEAAGGRAVAVACDITDPASVDAFTDAAHDHFGRLDLVVADAGALDSAGLAGLSDDRRHGLLEVDLTGVLRTLRSASAAMTGGGAMVAVLAIAGGVHGRQHHAHYAAARSGVLGLVRSLAVEPAPRGIRANSVRGSRARRCRR
ncbi:SDR family oxidoreductase [Streptomyces albidoflavus]|uniref:SDR family NAD(P)-dependent oxidoreductase n=1 Tax=Streptomyces albidoflavus TaxID=1886 RepID=UPI0033CD7DBA